MTRVGTRLCAGLAAALLAAALLSACGSSSSDSSGSTGEANKAKPESGAKPSVQGQGTKSGQSEAEGNGSAGQSNDGSSAKHGVTPLQVSGGGSGQFRVKGGDNSIQDFGDEASDSELREIAEIVHGFYVARVERRWDRACAYLSKQNIEQLEQLASHAKRENVDCGTVLEALTRTLPASVERQITTVDARSFRHDSEQGFLIYYGAGKVVYAMPLRAEDGTWKVSALVGTTLG